MASKTGSSTSSGLRKLRAADRHKKLLETHQNKKNTLKEVVSKCMEKLKINYTKLSILCGTINLRRCNDIINDVYLDSSWYKNRKKTRDKKNG